jgi:serine/threonine-protein kinase
MLTGKALFAGPTVSDTLAAVLKGEVDLAAIPPEVRPVLERCLRRDPRRRWQAIGDVRVALEDGMPAAHAPRRSVWPWPVTAVLAMALAVAGVGWWRASRPVGHPLTRLSVDLGPAAVTGLNTTVAISLDGRRLVFPARGPDGKQQLATRLLDQAQATLLPGTESGYDPFFSPDGQWIGFTASSQLKKVSVQGGAPVTLCSASLPRGASWGEDGNIVAALSNVGPLSRIPAAGGTAQPLTKLGAGEVIHRWPQVLPGGQAVLFTASPTTTGLEGANIEAVSVKTGQVKMLQRGGYYGRYLPSGHLVYVHQGVLFGVGFDVGRLELRGTPTRLLEDMAANPAVGGGQFDVSGAASGSGTLVYLAGKAAAQTWQVAWLESSGKLQPVITAPGAYAYPRLSPDGRKLAFDNGTDIIYVHDLERDTETRLTFTGGSRVPVWTPDGKHIAFRSDGSSIFWIRSDGAGEPQRLLESRNVVVPWSFSPDGRHLAYVEISPETGSDIGILPLDTTDPDRPKPGKPEPFLRTPADETIPGFSPDGRWIAYRSNETGKYEIYVQPFPAGGGGRWQISAGDGLYALWSNNGRELFYETADNRIMVVDYAVEGASFVVRGKPRLWSDKPLSYNGTPNLDLAPDGKRFAVFLPPEEAAPAEHGSVHVTMLLNFFDELKRKLP